MPDGDYKIKFTTTADLRGAQDLLKNTKEQTAAAKELKAALDDVNKSTRARVEANIAASKGARESSGFGDRTGADEARIQRRLAAQREENKAVDEGAKATDNFALSNKQLASAVKLVSHEIPGAAVLIHGLRNPYIGAAAAVAGLVYWYKRQIEAEDEATASAAAHIAAMTALEGATRTNNKIAADAATAANAYADALKRIDDEAQKAAGAVGAANEKIDDELRIRKEAIEVEKQLALAKLNTARAGGAVDDVEFARQKASIEGGSDAQVAAAVAGAQKKKMDVLAGRHLAGIDAAAAAEKELPGLRAELDRRKKIAARRAELEGGEGGAAAGRAAALKQSEEEEVAATRVIARIDASANKADTFEMIQTKARERAEAVNKLNSARGTRFHILGAQSRATAAASSDATGISGQEKLIREAEGRSVGGRSDAASSLREFLQFGQSVNRSADADRRLAPDRAAIQQQAIDAAEIKRLNDLNNAALKESATGLREATTELLDAIRAANARIRNQASDQR